MQIQGSHDIGVCIVIDMGMIFIGAHNTIYIISMGALIPCHTTRPKFSRPICQIAANLLKPL